MKVGPALSLVALFALTFIAPPAMVIAQGVGKTDQRGVYLMLSLNPTELPTSARSIGAEGSFFGQFIQVSESHHESLRAAGVVLLPASALAEICGISPEGWG